MIEANTLAPSSTHITEIKTSKQIPEWNGGDLVGLNVKCLKFFAILFPEDKEGHWADLTLVRVVFFFGFFFLSQISSEIVNISLNIRNPEKLISASLLFLTHVVQTSKYYQVYRYQIRFRNLIQSISREEFKPKTREQTEILQRYARTSNIITKIFLGACVGTCLFWGLYPFAEEQLRLPLPGWFPWSTDTPFKFAATFTYQTLAATINGLGNITINTTIAGLIMVICAQLHILNNSLKHLRELAESEMSGNILEDEVTPELQIFMDKHLKECIDHHQCIMKFTYEFSSLFSSSMLGQFLTSVVIICITLFEMALIPIGSLKFFSLVLYLFCKLLEIFLWCYYGNEVSFQSSKLTSFAFECDWNNCSKKFRRNLLFFMTSSQRVLKLYAGGLLTLSLETFVHIIKSSWSYFAVLLQVTTKT